MKQRKHIPEAEVSVAIKPRRVVMVVYPDAHILDVAGPLEVLTGSSLFLPNSSTLYETCLVAHQTGAFRTTSGLTLQADQEFTKARRSRKPIDTLIIAGGHGSYGTPPEAWGHAPRVFIGGMALFKGKPADPAESKSDNPPVLSSAGTLHLNCEDWAKLLQLFQRDSHIGVIEDKIIERVLRLPQKKGARMSMGWAPAYLEGLSVGAQGSNMRWSATVLMDDAQRRTAFVVCNDGRSSVLRQSALLTQRLLQL